MTRKMMQKSNNNNKPKLSSLTVPIIFAIFFASFSTIVQCFTVRNSSKNGTLANVKNVSLLKEQSGNSEVVLRSSNGTERNSRQLWSVIQNVVDKYKHDKNNGNNNNNNKPALAGALGTFASSFIGNLIANGVSSSLGTSSPSSSSFNPNQFNQHPYHDDYQQPQTPPPPKNPNDYMHYLLLNSQANQHSSVDHYHKQKFESTSDLIEKYKEQMTSSASTLGNHDGDSTMASTGNQLLSKLALGSIFDDGGLEKFSNFLSFGSVEKMMEKVNKFDKLKCIPRLLCQMVAKRQEDSRLGESSTSTTTSRPGKAKRRKSDDNDKEVNDDVPPQGKEGDDEKAEDGKKSTTKSSENDDRPNGKQSKENESNENEEEEEEDDDDDDDENGDDDENDSDEKEYVVIKGGSQNPKLKQESRRNGRIFKINGADTALEQVVKFLELMQLKDWSLYPYINGAYQGHQVQRTEDCAYKFPSCPFSDDQLVYYFNNYNGGFFQSI